MDYSIVFRFDEEAEAQMSAWTEAVAQASGHHFMKENGIPPHITMAFCHKDQAASQEELSALFDDCASLAASGALYFPSIGIFSSTIFAAPVLNAYLLDQCAAFNARLEHFADRMNTQYQPYNWVPHATICSLLEPDALRRALPVIHREFAAFPARTARVALVRCHWYEELYSRALDN